MAKQDETKNEKKQNDSQKGDGANEKVGLLSWLIVGAVVAACATGGLALSHLIGGQDPSQPASQSQPNNTSQRAFEDLLAAQAANGASPWIYEAIEPVMANLDEPGVTRYVRVTVSLEISAELNPEKGKEFLNRRTMVLRDWLTTYFAGLSLEDVRGSRNLNRIKRDIEDEFNKLLFPDNKPYIQQVLFREFAVQ